MSCCFLLRDGRKQLCERIPDGLETYRYVDREGSEIQALLDPASQQRLLRAQSQRLLRAIDGALSHRALNTGGAGARRSA